MFGLSLKKTKKIIVLLSVFTIFSSVFTFSNAAKTSTNATQGPLLIIYDGANFSNTSYSVTHTVRYGSLTQLSKETSPGRISITNLNNKITSFKLKAGYKVTFYKGLSMTGGGFTVTTSGNFNMYWSDLSRDNSTFNNNIESLVLEPM